MDKPSFANKDAKSPTARYNKDHADFRGQADAKRMIFVPLAHAAGMN